MEVEAEKVYSNKRLIGNPIDGERLSSPSRTLDWGSWWHGAIDDEKWSKKQ